MPRPLSFPSTTGSQGLPILFVAIWSLMTLGFDGVLVYQAVQQCRVWLKPTCTGRVVRSRVGGEGDSYKPEIQYEYQVGGQQYTGTRRRTMELGISGDGAYAAVQRVVSRYPEGREVTVYYDRTDPSSSWLEAGPDGLDLFLWMFATPFNLIALGVLWSRRARTPAMPEETIDDVLEETGSGWCVVLERISRLAITGVVLGGLAFLGIFVVAFTAGLQPSTQLMSVVWAVILGISLVIGWRFGGQKNGLTIDLLARTLTISRAGKSPLTLRLDRLRGLSFPSPASRSDATGDEADENREVAWAEDEAAEDSEWEDFQREPEELADGEDNREHEEEGEEPDEDDEEPDEAGQLLLEYQDDAGQTKRIGLVANWPEAKVTALAHWLQQKLSIPLADREV